MSMVRGPVNKENVKAIILASSLDFGRCPLAAHLSPSLWPVMGRPVLENLLRWLGQQGIKNAVVCSDGCAALPRESVCGPQGLEVSFMDEQLPSGTAGCIRDAMRDEKDSLLLVLSACTICPPEVDAMICAHRDGGAELTVMFNPGSGNDNSIGKAADIYVCSTGILEYIPQEGHFDIKEGLIPAMLRGGKGVRAEVLPRDAGNFRGWQEYLCAISGYLEKVPDLETNPALYRESSSQQTIWRSPSASIEADVRMCGQVVIMDDARISSGAVIIGPAVVGRNVSVGNGSVVANSILWDNARVGSNCTIGRSVVDHSAVVPSNSVVEEQVVAFRPVGAVKGLTKKVFGIVEKKASMIQAAMQSKTDKVIERMPNRARPYMTGIVRWGWVGFLVAAFLWSYRSEFIGLWNIWQRSDEYSCGLLVPFLAGYILWSRRSDIAQYAIKPCLWGVLAFVLAEAFRLFGLFFMYASAERLSIVLSVAALVLLMFGWQLFRKVSPILLFLLLMLPWPARFQAAIAQPLQQAATSSAAFCLETIGYDVVREGNILHIGNTTVAVAEACNGLRMITAFVVISGWIMLLVKRMWWEKLIILISSLPIALLCNTVRLAVTAIAFTMLSGEQWEKVFHDFGGYAMMPLALAIMVAELWLLTKLTIRPQLQVLGEQVDE
jgi:exosortase